MMIASMLLTYSCLTCEQITTVPSADPTEDGEDEVADDSSITNPTALKILFLSSDTGGGHRASAESLAKQFQLLYPGSTYNLLDIVEKDGVPPYNSLVSYYKHLSHHPTQWKLVYSVSNSRAFEMIADAHLKLMCERAVRRSIKEYDPDVVVSVHPLMCNVPVLSCQKISKETNRHLPMFTVVTDLGSAHCLWFANGVEKMFVGSEQVKELAKIRGRVPEDKLVLSGLPIRHDFAVQAELLGNRMSAEGIEYQRKVRRDLELPHDDRKTLLVMGGGEGVGSLGRIVNSLYCELVSQGIDALVMVVCGRNEKLKKEIETKDWSEVYKRWTASKERHGNLSQIFAVDNACGSALLTPGCINSGSTVSNLRRMLSRGSLQTAMMAPLPDSQHFMSSQIEEKKADPTDAIPVVNSILSDSDELKPTLSQSSLEDKTFGKVYVLSLGFVTNMAEYMVAADVLVSKAGPGTIAEAAALSLPIMLTSYLPGQEEGNADYVVEAGFGAFCHESDPAGIAEEVCMWLSDDDKRAMLSRAAHAKGAPDAARRIAQQIGDATLKWREINKTKDTEAKK
jgi:UDP-N-acetylglucosamine:LPS N-acetylglucosamine transferase